MSSNEFHTSPGRNPLLLVGGAILIGLALALVLFGGALFGPDGQEAEAALPQVPASSGGATSSQSGGTRGVLQVGDTPHDFVLNDLDGNPISLSDFKGQPVILNFWATWCAPCRIEMPELQNAFVTHQDKNLVILAVDNQESPKAVELFFNELGLTFLPILDIDGKVAEQYKVVNFPTTYFINPEGQITAVHRGLMVKSQLDGYLAQTIPGL